MARVSRVARHPTVRGDVVALVGTVDGALDGPWTAGRAASVSADYIDTLLARLRSPLAGQGAAIVADSRRSGLDPLVFVSLLAAPPLGGGAGVSTSRRISAQGGVPSVLSGVALHPDGFAQGRFAVRDWFASRAGRALASATDPLAAWCAAQFAVQSRVEVESCLNELRAIVAAWRAALPPAGRAA